MKQAFNILIICFEHSSRDLIRQISWESIDNDAEDQTAKGWLSSMFTNFKSEGANNILIISSNVPENNWMSSFSMHIRNGGHFDKLWKIYYNCRKYLLSNKENTKFTANDTMTEWWLNRVVSVPKLLIISVFHVIIVIIHWDIEELSVTSYIHWFLGVMFS